jgi:hypothetical protein
MKKTINNILLYFYLKLNSLLLNIGIILNRGEKDVFKINSEIPESKKRIQRMLYKNEFLEMLVSDKKNDVIIQKYYEVLKKADFFIKKSTPHQMAVAADKHGSNYGMKDIYGRRYEHYGFFDDKHKHVGKTLGEVLTTEIEERKTNDDDYEIMYMFNNNPIQVGLSKIFEVVDEIKKPEEITENITDKEKTASIHKKVVYKLSDIKKKSKTYEFPIKVIHNNENVVNKIEELTKFLHVKKIGLEYRQLEFFIPLDFKTNEFDNDSDIINNIIDVKEVYVLNEYGEIIGFSVDKFLKRIEHNSYDVFKFTGIQMEIINK